MATPTYSSISKPALKLGEGRARASGVTHPREVNSTKPKQTTAHRDRTTKGLVHRDGVRGAVTIGNESNCGDRGAKDHRLRRARGRGFSTNAEPNTGTVGRSGQRERSSVQRAARDPGISSRHLIAADRNSSLQDRNTGYINADCELPSIPGVDGASYPYNPETKVSIYPCDESESSQTNAEDDNGHYRDDENATNSAEYDTAELPTAIKSEDCSETGATLTFRSQTDREEEDDGRESTSPRSRDNNKDFEEFSLEVPSHIHRGSRSSNSASSPNIPVSLESPQFRRLESRRGSSVTFILPAHVSSECGSSHSSSQRQSISTEAGAQLRARYNELYSRRMSAPELPPIADRERHRPPSRSTSKSSLNQLTAAVNSKNFYTRLTGGATLHRNHSDSSLKGLLAASQGPTQSSCSVSSYPSGGGGVGGGGGGSSGPGEVGLPPPHLHRSSSRALSWCATENSNGSIPKLETLFERKNVPAINSNNSANNAFTSPGTPPPQVLKNNNNNNSYNNKNINYPANNMIPPRSVSVNGIRRSDSQELAKIKSRKKRLQSECGAGELETLGTIEQFGRLKVNGMRRSVSDNKLVDKKNVRNARLNSSRHVSVSRTDKLTHRKTSRHGTSVSGTKGGMRRVSSVSAINSIANNRTRIDSNQDSENVDITVGGGSEDSEEEEERSLRIREWLLGLDCADVPPEPVIEYADDPPQTDTALHIVYNADS